MEKYLFGGIYKKRRVLVTGHTGFKGSWLCKWLEILGAKVVGYALKPVTDQNHFDQSGLKIESYFDDIGEYSKIKWVFSKFQPEIVFHLAAQPLVLESYNNPIKKFFFAKIFSFSVTNIWVFLALFIIGRPSGAGPFPGTLNVRRASDGGLTFITPPRLDRLLPTVPIAKLCIWFC